MNHKINKKDNESQNELTLDCYYDTIKNVTNITDININDMLIFKNNEITKNTAEQYVNIMVELTEKISNLSTPKIEKERFKMLFTMLFSKMCEADCNSLLLSASIQKNKKNIKIINKMYDEFQKERDEHNLLAKKYNEKEKDKKVGIPYINLSLTVKNNKILKPNECLDFMSELELEDKELDQKFKRLSIPSDYKDKIDRAYAKSSNNGNNIIQKTKK
jgi:hypothetical protein